mmetsp:Transcript_24743/g.79918  ORF Transcript_24743/g.79918 Transcript_24743/m.79918 type:complete len:215 (+) Transcript_24743:267-911(+)
MPTTGPFRLPSVSTVSVGPAARPARQSYPWALRGSLSAWNATTSSRSAPPSRAAAWLPPMGRAPAHHATTCSTGCAIVCRSATIHTWSRRCRPSHCGSRSRSRPALPGHAPRPSYARPLQRAAPSARRWSGGETATPASVSASAHPASNVRPLMPPRWWTRSHSPPRPVWTILSQTVKPPQREGRPRRRGSGCSYAHSVFRSDTGSWRCVRASS